VFVFLKQRNIYEIAVRKMLMKLTPVADPIKVFFFLFRFLLFSLSVLLYIEKTLLIKLPSLEAKNKNSMLAKKKKVL